jgi:hypothetical protein
MSNDTTNLMSSAEPAKFALLKDFGYVEVPADYDHSTALARLKAMHYDDCYYFNSLLTDANFDNPSRVLKAVERYRVRAYEQVSSGTTSSVERVEFLQSLPGNVFIGAQGIPLVFEQKRHYLPKGKWYSSFDELDRLPFLEGCHRVPSVTAYLDGDFRVGLGNFEGPWDQDLAVLCFSDE